MYIAIQNFKYGLDTRRIELTTQPGALSTLNNAVVNQGGEIVKRKAFVRIALPASTFGLLSTSAGLAIFGSIATPAGLPAGVVYVRCQHPNGTSAMTAFVGGCTFGGLSMALCTFADGSTFAFYDGTLVPDFVAGLVLAFQTTATAGNNNLIASHLNTLINATDFASSSSSLSVVTVNSPLGATLDLATSITSAVGTLAMTLITSVIAPIVGTKAAGAFTVVAGTSSAGTNKVTSVKVGTQQLLTGPGTAVDWTTSNEATATLLVTAINAYSGTSGYSAVQAGATVNIYATTTGTTPNNKVVEIVAAGNVCIGRGVFGLAVAPGATATPGAVNSILIDGVDVLKVGGAATPVAFSTTLEAQCTAIVAGIAAGDSNATYLACAIGATVFLSKKTTKSSDASLPVIISVATGGGVTGGNGENTPGLVTAVTPVIVNRALSTLTLITSAVVTSATTGGTLPYTYDWEQVSITQPTGYNTNAHFVVNAQSPTAYATAFTMAYNRRDHDAPTGPIDLLATAGMKVVSVWRCKVTDASGAFIESNEITVNMYR